ncbi:MAG: hypothetical protein ACLS9K_06995 [Lachnospira eligens]
MLAISLQRVEEGRSNYYNNARKAISVNIKADYINVDVVGLKGRLYTVWMLKHILVKAAHILRNLLMRKTCSGLCWSRCR